MKKQARSIRNRCKHNKQVKRLYKCKLKERRLLALIPTTKELARQSGIHKSTLGKIERGEMFLPAHIALLLCPVLGCTLDDLYELKSGS